MTETTIYHVFYYHAAGQRPRPLVFHRFHDMRAFADFLLTDIYVHALFVGHDAVQVL